MVAPGFGSLSSELFSSETKENGARIFFTYIFFWFHFK